MKGSRSLFKMGESSDWAALYFSSSRVISGRNCFYDFLRVVSGLDS